MSEANLSHVWDASLIQVTRKHLLVKALRLPASVCFHDILARYADHVHDITIKMVSGIEARLERVTPRRWLGHAQRERVWVHQSLCTRRGPPLNLACRGFRLW